ncbi:hypothetical protein K035_2617 [Acinetobacter baumannii 42057_4]|nr:hypothetical protein J727_2666 [Acinetobacter baumannii 472237-120]EXH17770.1 hypothetical protein J636_2376 [Acinetobacter baumannii 1271213]EXR37110.1 hypothetical protein J668_2626 [Acinetobacter baumannii 1276470-86]EZI43297.1 hypothetical protein K037_2735 [Acinetobacter baumannii 42057_6]KCW19410.1 hypothetical protein K035_2617 [Acinetobacter baumannii 42057_4]KCZ15651.1 hypothetical protein K036_4153 [Acinetobacter baumannii 42057_5]KCZ16508.1 hypothetical protein K034_3161 [Acinet
MSYLFLSCTERWVRLKIPVQKNQHLLFGLQNLYLNFML